MGSRNLRDFEVPDPNPPRRSVKPNEGDGAPAKLETLAWDGRHLDAIARSNFPRGGSYTAVRDTSEQGGWPRGKSEKSASPSQGEEAASSQKGAGCGKSRSCDTKDRMGIIKCT